jgi:hypothetical protein
MPAFSHPVINATPPSMSFRQDGHARSRLFVDDRTDRVGITIHSAGTVMTLRASPRLANR